MNKYMIPVRWEMAGYMTIEANSQEDAIEIATDARLPEGEYINDSFQIDEELIEVYNLKDSTGHIIEPFMEVDVNEPDATDPHKHSFRGYILRYQDNKVIVEDDNNDAFELNPEKVTIVPPNDQ
jgi:hypothetical protein